MPIKPVSGKIESQEINNNLSYLDAQKRDRNEEIEMRDLSQEVKEGMTGGSVPVVGKDSVDNINLKNNAVTQEKTRFAQKGKNKWNGIFTRNARIGGAQPYYFLERTGSTSVVFQGEPGKTYTISRPSNEGELYQVATFIDEPQVNDYANRSLNSGDSSWETYTVTLESTEKFIVISFSDNNVTPSWFQIEEGEESTEYSSPDNSIFLMEEESVPFKSLKQNEIQITPEQATFVQRGKNIWDGKFIYGMRAGGGGEFYIINRSSAVMVLFEGEPGKTYTISRPADEVELFHVATFINEPKVNDYANRSLNGGSGSTSWESYTVTLQAEERYIVISISDDHNVVPSWFQIEEGNEATGYVPHTAVHIDLDNGGTIENTEKNKINVVKSGDTMHIYVPSKSDYTIFMRHTYRLRANSVTNTWLYDRTGVYKKSNGAYTLLFEPSPGNSDNEGVLRLEGEGDFIGGKHGFDFMEQLDVIIDGKEVDMTTDFDIYCSFINIMNKSRVNHDETEDLPENKAFTRYKIHTWDLDKMIMQGRWIAEHDMTIVSGKLCDFSVDKISNEKVIAKWGRKSNGFEKVDLQTDFGDTYVGQGHWGVENVEIWSDEVNFYINLHCEWDKDKYSNGYTHIAELEGTRAKIYFDITGRYDILAGEEINYKNTYEFRF